MTRSGRNSLRDLVLAALFLAIALVLPLVTGQIRTIGKMLLPMHLPVLLCGFLLGWRYGLAVGFLAPLLRSGIFGMPIFYPGAVGMAFELAAYGAVAGLLAEKLPSKPGWIYADLLIAMVSGRLVWGAVRFGMLAFGTEFSLPLFLAGAVTESIPGIVLQIVLVPPLVLALRRVIPRGEAGV